MDIEFSRAALNFLQSAERPTREWDPDFTKLTPSERADLEKSERDLREGRTVRMEDIDWD